MIFKVTRAACQCTATVFLSLGRSMETDLEKIIKAMGIVGREDKEINLLSKITPFLSKEYPGEIRKEAITFLYGFPQFEEEVSKTISFFERSPDANERALVAEVAGKLKIKSYKDYLINLNRLLGGIDPHVIIALMKLKVDSAHKDFYEVVMEASQEDKIKMVSLFSEIKENRIRYNFYEYLCQNHSDEITYFIMLMMQSKKDFKSDFSLLQDEADRLGIDVNLDEYGFRANILHSKKKTA